MDELTRLAKAVSDPSRLRVLMLLRGGELCACRIIEILGLAPSTVSAHMAVLERSGLVRFRKEGTWRHYRIAADDCSPLARKMLDLVQGELRNDPASVSDGRRLRSIKASMKACGAQAGKTA